MILLSGCASSTTIPAAWMSVPETPRIASIALDADGKVAPSAQPQAKRTEDGPIHIVADAVGPRLANGEKILTDPFLAIDSFDYSESRGEVAFSAKRDSRFDVGLVSSDGSPISWVPSDPADEIGVQWAPRGNKISYILRGKGGDIVRTLHIPTAAHLAVEFPNAVVHALAWDPQAERYAVAYSTPTSSDRVEVMRYDGTDRRTAIPPSVTLETEVEPFIPESMLLRPREIHYGERVPVVIWVDENFGWSDARAALIKSARVAVVVTSRVPDEAFWRAVADTRWIDAKRAWLVAPNALPTKHATLITGDQALSTGESRRKGSVVTAPPRVVQSFAAGFIADELKRTAPTNVRSR